MDKKLEDYLLPEVLDLRNDTIRCNGTISNTKVPEQFLGLVNSIGFSLNDTTVVAVGGYEDGAKSHFTKCEYT